MRSYFLLAAWSLLAGAGIPLIGVLNGGLAKSIGNPFTPTAVMFAVALLIAVGITLPTYRDSDSRAAKCRTCDGVRARPADRILCLISNDYHSSLRCSELHSLYPGRPTFHLCGRGPFRAFRVAETADRRSAARRPARYPLRYCRHANWQPAKLEVLAPAFPDVLRSNAGVAAR